MVARGLRCLAFAASLVMVTPWSGQGQDRSDARIKWYDSYAEGVREAKRTRQPIFLEFRCAP
jgi:hypothetical protein